MKVEFFQLHLALFISRIIKTHTQFFLQENQRNLWGHSCSAMMRSELLSSSYDGITPVHCMDRCDWLIIALFHTLVLSTLYYYIVLRCCFSSASLSCLQYFPLIRHTVGSNFYSGDSCGNPKDRKKNYLIQYDYTDTFFQNHY